MSIQKTDVNYVTNVKSLKACLDYIYVEAMNTNHRLAAHLIGAASEALGKDAEPRPAGTGDAPKRRGAAKRRSSHGSGSAITT